MSSVRRHVDVSARRSKAVVSGFAEFEKILGLAERFGRSADLDSAAALACIAARTAFPTPIGIFGSPRLERLIRTIGRRLTLGPPSSKPPVREQGKLRVLHVLTYARPVGGDTRYVWRWIKEDRGRTHSVAITTQLDTEAAVPEELRQAVAASGGTVSELQTPGDTLTSRALELRRRCRQADIVALHLFPWDTVPLLALAHECPDQRVVFVHHSDHTFWIGGSVAHAMVNLRSQDDDFLESRRGLRPPRSYLVPIPIESAPVAASKEAAKAALGLSSDRIVLLTIATGFKYEPLEPQGGSLLDLVSPVLEEHPQAVLLAVGPGNEPQWAGSPFSTNGQIRTFGKRWQNSDLLAAADVYLDSYPLSSITSLLEAGVQGLPILACRLPNEGLSLVGPGAPGLDEGLVFAANAAAYRQTLERLITDEGYRDERARIARDRITAHHSGEHWLAGVDEMIAGALSIPSEDTCLAATDLGFDDDDLSHVLGRIYGHDRDVSSLADRYLAGLPIVARSRSIVALLRMGFDVPLGRALPPRVAQACGAAGRQVGRAMKVLLAH